MTDAKYDEYAKQIAPIRDAFLIEVHRLEAETAARIEDALKDLRGLAHASPIEFIEGCYTRALDKRLKQLDDEYQRTAARIRQEVGLE